MYQYTPSAPVRTYSVNRIAAAFSIGESDLHISPLLPYAYWAVWKTRQQTAKFWDIYPTKGGNTVTLRRFFFVCTMRKRLMPGMRGLQDGENRNKRVVSFRTIDVPGNICPNLKSKEYETMNATISMGVHAPNPLQALARLLPTGTPFPIAKPPKRHQKAANGLQLVLGTDGNITAYHNANPVAWIVAGYHYSQETGLRCEFVDVAYRRQTRNGINMETMDFLTLPEAVSFINGVFGSAV